MKRIWIAKVGNLIVAERAFEDERVWSVAAAQSVVWSGDQDSGTVSSIEVLPAECTINNGLAIFGIESLSGSESDIILAICNHPSIAKS